MQGKTRQDFGGQGQWPAEKLVVGGSVRRTLCLLSPFSFFHSAIRQQCRASKSVLRKEEGPEGAVSAKGGALISSARSRSDGMGADGTDVGREARAEGCRGRGMYGGGSTREKDDGENFPDPQP